MLYGPPSFCLAIFGLLSPLMYEATLPAVDTPLVALEDAKIPLGMERCGLYFAADKTRNARTIWFSYRSGEDLMDEVHPSAHVVVKLPKEGDAQPTVPLARADGDSVIFTISLADYVQSPCLPADYSPPT